jgi:Tfp pilus assembly protein PilF
MDRSPSNLQKSLFFIIFLYFIQPRLIAQADTIFKFDSNRRLIQLWKIAESDLFQSGDSGRVFHFLDTLGNLAKLKKDERLYFYTQYFKILYNGRKWHHVKKEIAVLEENAGWIANCPVRVIQSSYDHLLGQLYFVDKQFAKAFELQLHAQKEFSEIGYDNIPEIGFYLSSLGNNYYQFEDYDKCLYYLELSEKYTSIFNRNKISVLNTQGMVYQKRQQYTKADEKFLQAIRMAENYADSTWVGIASGNYGNTLMLEGKYKEAVPFLLSDVQLNQKNEPSNTAITTVYLANAYIQINDLAKAREFLDLGLQLQNRIIKEEEKKHPTFYKNYYQVKALYYSKLNDYYRAYLYLDSCMVLKDSLKTIFNTQVLNTTEQRIASEKYLANLALAENQRTQAILKRNILLFILLTGALLLFLLFRLQKNKAKKEALFHEQKEKLMAVEHQQVQDKLAHAEILLNEYISNLSEKNDLLGKIKNEMEEIRSGTEIPIDDEKIKKLNELMQLSILTEADWQKFRHLFENVYPGFFAMIRNVNNGFTPAETRFLALLKLNLSQREMASVLGVSVESVTKLKYRLRKKLGELGIDKKLSDLVRNGS